MARHSADLGLSDDDKSVLQKREEHGWFVNLIAEDSEGPGFAYSFGLYEEFKHPEIIIFGLDSAIMHSVLNDAGDQVRKGARFSNGCVTGEILQGYNCVFRQVNPHQYHEFCGWAVWFYGNSDFPVLQLFWPDKKGRFPWDDDFTESLRDLQPDLSKPTSST